MTITLHEMLPVAVLPDVQNIVPDGLDGLMNGYERNVLIALLNRIEAETVIEIGVHRGHCASRLLQNVPSIKRYIGVDVPPGYRTALPSQQSEVLDNPGELVLGDDRFELIVLQNGSLDLDPVKLQLPICDAFLIDGDHSAAAVRHDSLLARALVRPGGLILWHDYWPPWANEVVAVLHEFHAYGRNIRHIPHTWLAMEVN